jgi:hypothetical protein
MGRELRRVPLDFRWPLGKVWGGYVNPYSSQAAQCPDCRGTGGSEEWRRLNDMWYGNAPFDPADRGSRPWEPADREVREIAERILTVRISAEPAGSGMVEEAIQWEARRLAARFNRAWCHHLDDGNVKALLDADRLWDFTRRPRTPGQEEALKAQEGSKYWLDEPNGYVPTAREVNTWSLCGIGHDGLNHGIVVSDECKRRGVVIECGLCGGEGSLWPSKEVEALHGAWEPFDPPTGEGFQLWSTTSEGEPSSPVFGTLEELCDWCEGNATVFGSSRATSAEWFAMLSPGGMVAHKDEKTGAVFI